MAQPTTPYKKSVSGSLGAGMKSLLGGNDRRYYVLEHKVSSKYHKAGENQRIIVDQIELGRASTCQVRFDETFATVSRRHAAIVKDGDNWKLVQLSKTNSTYLNGHKVDKEWYLQNGDEIQLSTNGPRMGFIVPAGEKGLVKSIGLSARLSLFRKQALRPYKQAIACLAALLILTSGGSIGWMFKQNSDINRLTAINDATSTALESVKGDNQELKQTIEDMRVRARQRDSIIDISRKEIQRLKDQPRSVPVPAVADLIHSVQSSVYFIVTTVYMKLGSGTQNLGSSSGTAFLLNDGRFVTARHCVESWLFSSPEANVMNESYSNVSVWSEIKAYGVNGDDFTLKSSDFTIDRSMDTILDAGIDENGTQLKMRLAYYYKDNDPESGEEIRIGNVKAGSADWAVARIQRQGNIKPNTSLSSSLPQGCEVHVLGFPAGLGAGDGPNRIEPIYNKMNVARNGLNNEGCIMVSQGVAHGNSGGPVFAVKDGKIYAVAIVSRLEIATQMRNESRTAILQQQQQYDQLVPIKNIR